MEFEPLIFEGGVNKIKSEGGKVVGKQSRVRELGDVKKRKLRFCFGAKLALVFYVLFVYHLYYLAKIPQMPLGDITIKFSIDNIPEAFGEFWSIIKMNFID